MPKTAQSVRMLSMFAEGLKQSDLCRQYKRHVAPRVHGRLIAVWRTVSCRFSNLLEVMSAQGAAQAQVNGAPLPRPALGTGYGAAGSLSNLLSQAAQERCL